MTWLNRQQLPEIFKDNIRSDRRHGVLFKVEDVVISEADMTMFWKMFNSYHEHFCLPSPEVPVYGYEYLRIGEAYDDIDHITSPVKVGYLNVKRVAVLDPPWHETKPSVKEQERI